MPQPRKALVSVDTTPSYHVVSRCVRRTFLSGVVDNKDFSHRRHAIVRRLSELTQLFCIDISARQTEAPHPKRHTSHFCAPEHQHRSLAAQL